MRAGGKARSCVPPAHPACPLVMPLPLPALPRPPAPALAPHIALLVPLILGSLLTIAPAHPQCAADMSQAGHLLVPLGGDAAADVPKAVGGLDWHRDEG